MRPDIRNLIDTLATDLLAEESLSCQHRIKDLELRGRLAALANEYPRALISGD